MEIKEFLGKFKSLYLWGNLMAMVLLIVLLCFGVKIGLELYTHHGEAIKVPNLSKMSFDRARMQLEQAGLVIMVSDSGYNKKLPPSCVLAQTPAPGVMVKAGHAVYVTVNSPSSPMLPIPDIVDNSSFREAEAKLMAMGFKLLSPQQVPGEKDWVYGIAVRGRRLATGDMVSIESPLTLLIGSGMYGEDEDIDYTDGFASFGEDDLDEELPEESGSDVDDFEEVTEP